jgi:hypothetical protein
MIRLEEKASFEPVNGFHRYELVEHMRDGSKEVLHECWAIDSHSAYRLLSRHLMWKWSTMDRTFELIEVEP